MSQTHEDSATWLAARTSGGNPSCLHPRRGSKTVAVERRQPRTGLSKHVGASTAWQASECGLDLPGSDRKRGQAAGILEWPAARDRGYIAQNAGPPPESSLQALAREHVGLVGGDGRPGQGWGVSNSRPGGCRGGQPDDAAMGVGDAKRARSRDSHGKVSGTRSSRPRSSVDSPHTHDSFNYYPLRPTSAEAVVSLISPRTSKKIRRLPPPGQLERESLEVKRGVGQVPVSCLVPRNLLSFVVTGINIAWCVFGVTYLVVSMEIHGWWAMALPLSCFGRNAAPSLFSSLLARPRRHRSSFHQLET